MITRGEIQSSAVAQHETESRRCHSQQPHEEGRVLTCLAYEQRYFTIKTRGRHTLLVPCIARNEHHFNVMAF